MKRLALFALVAAIAGCATAGPARRPEPAGANFAASVSNYVAGTLSGGSATETLPGPGGASSGIGMTHTAGAVGSPAGAGNATGAATPGAPVSTLVIGNVALIGIHPTVIPGGATGAQVVSDTRARVLERFGQFNAVFITTEPTRVAQIADLHARMLSGASAVDLMEEIQTVVRTVR